VPTGQRAACNGPRHIRLWISKSEGSARLRASQPRSALTPPCVRMLAQESEAQPRGPYTSPSRCAWAACAAVERDRLLRPPETASLPARRSVSSSKPRPSRKQARFRSRPRAPRHPPLQ
jgi:hypothetical protein